MARDEARIKRDLQGYPGRLCYEVRADLGEGIGLTFDVVFEKTPEGWSAYPKMDGGAPGATFEAARLRCAAWFDAAARAMRGDRVATLVSGWSTASDPNNAEEIG